MAQEADWTLKKRFTEAQILASCEKPTPARPRRNSIRA
jgi:hypothetical protein